MLNNDIYAIYTDNSEYNGSVKELYASFDEAMKDRFKYANWFMEYGDVWILLYKGGDVFSSSHSWHIRPDGTVESEYDF